MSMVVFGSIKLIVKRLRSGILCNIEGHLTNMCGGPSYTNSCLFDSKTKHVAGKMTSLIPYHTTPRFYSTIWGKYKQ